MSEDKQDKIISLLGQITKQNQTEIDNQKHLINNQVSLSSVIMDAQNKIVNGPNGVMQSINGLSTHNSATNQPTNENSNEFSDLSKITDRLDDITRSINRNHSAVTQCIKKSGDHIASQSFNNTKDLLNQLSVNGQQIEHNGKFNYENFATLNVISRIIVDLENLGSDIFAATNSTARKQGAFFYTNHANPGGYRATAKRCFYALNHHRYFQGNDDNDN